MGCFFYTIRGTKEGGQGPLMVRRETEIPKWTRPTEYVYFNLFYAKKHRPKEVNHITKPPHSRVSYIIMK